MIKTYYQLQLTQKSPLRIGNGNGEETDNDLLLDGRGLPFVPGSSIAGILREMIFNKYDKNTADKVFGFVGKEGVAESRKILISDAVLDYETDISDVRISTRDGVGLDDWGMTIQGAKYNFQIVETNKCYTAIIESDLIDVSLEKCLEDILLSAVSDGLHFGARSTRGYGAMQVIVKKKIFDLTKDLEAWLDFSPYEKDAFVYAEQLTTLNYESNRTTIEIGFELADSMIIRVKEANYITLEDGTNPDTVTLKNSKKKPVIPGTSWAGSFRHHMRNLYKMTNADINSEDITSISHIFGQGINGKNHTRSIICFSESEINGGKPQTSMRNAIDRFTAAPSNAALFTTQVWKGGTGQLTISYETDKLKTEDKQLLAVAIMDLAQGLLTVGGEAGIGRGRIKVNSIFVNGNDRKWAIEKYDVQNLLEG